MLGFLFFITALVYASVGFGGGSTYNALLILMGVEYPLVPLIALSCNIVVVSGGVWHFSRSGAFSVRDTLPWVAMSVPMAWVGGYIVVSKIVFMGVLGTTLLVSAVQMLVFDGRRLINTPVPSYTHHKILPFVIGGGLGLVAGITGIGGGIFLAPVLHHMRWANAKNIAGMCSIFIWVNSVAGLMGQVAKFYGAKFYATGGGDTIWTAIFPYIWVVPLVFLGGQMGSWLGAFRIHMRGVKTLTGVLILYVALRLLYHTVSLL